MAVHPAAAMVVTKAAARHRADAVERHGGDTYVVRMLPQTKHAGRHLHKYQGTGNDFIVLDVTGEAVPAPPEKAQAAAWCDRHFGVGADGVLTVLPPAGDGAVARMHITNADGSVPEMCGNGLRCVALYLRDTRPALGGSFTVETDAGPRSCTVEQHAPGDGFVTLSMGQVRVGAQSGFTADVTRVVDGVTLRCLAVHVGNPHLVLDAPIPSVEVANRLGPGLVASAGFPHGTNVEWLVRDGDGLKVLVYERGVGLTLACGTGAVASACAAEQWGWVDLAVAGGVRVGVPGGDLWIGRAGDGQATLRGPARRVFAATVF